MAEARSSISNANTYEEIGEYWDEHDLGEIWAQTRPVEIEVDLRSERHYYSVDRTLSLRLFEIAEKRGVSAETLLNLWLQEKLQTASPGS